MPYLDFVIHIQSKFDLNHTFLSYQTTKMKTENINFEIDIPVVYPEDIQYAIIEAKFLTEKAGFEKSLQVLLSTVVSELVTNVIRYAEKGTVRLKVKSTVDNVLFEVTVTDKGPGIENIEKVMQDSYTTTQNSLGMGLSSLKRIMDDYEIVSVLNQGTKITARKWLYGLTL